MHIKRVQHYMLSDSPEQLKLMSHVQFLTESLSYGSWFRKTGSLISRSRWWQVPCSILDSPAFLNNIFHSLTISYMYIMSFVHSHPR